MMILEDLQEKAVDWILCAIIFSEFQKARQWFRHEIKYFLTYNLGRLLYKYCINFLSLDKNFI